MTCGETSRSFEVRDDLLTAIFADRAQDTVMNKVGEMFVFCYRLETERVGGLTE
jgi:hypothetical protein